MGDCIAEGVFFGLMSCMFYDFCRMCVRMYVKVWDLVIWSGYRMAWRGVGVFLVGIVINIYYFVKGMEYCS